MSSIRIALAQINTVVGDPQGNSEQIARVADRSLRDGADLVCFPELTVTGYPPLDLLLQEKFVEDSSRCLDELIPELKGLIALVGTVERGKAGEIYNSVAVVMDGVLAGMYRKQCLPNYGVFDEKRYFKPGEGVQVFRADKFKFAVSVCHDLWLFDAGGKGVVDFQAAAGAELLLNLSASPYEIGKHERRMELLQSAARRNGVVAAMVNQVGGQDELVFDGGSAIIAPTGEQLVSMPRFEAGCAVADVNLQLSQPAGRGVLWKMDAGDRGFSNPDAELPAPKSDSGLPKLEEIYSALKLGLRDFVHKCGFQKVGIALSGGIDSALTACLAADALGSHNVLGVAMPSRYSSPASLRDARELAVGLGMEFLEIPINMVHGTLAELIGESVQEQVKGVADENMQARIRGIIMMALSNMRGFMCLATGNKSEMATGYATLYGDMVGGMAPLKDVSKTLVRQLSRRLKQRGVPIPTNTITREPSAELRPNQRDSDSLPDYDALDAVLEEYVELRQGAKRTGGINSDELQKVLLMVNRSEYKRYQSPPGIKVTSVAFGRDRRMPITCSGSPNRG